MNTSPRPWAKEIGLALPDHPGGSELELDVDLPAGAAVGHIGAVLRRQGRSPDGVIATGTV